MLRTGFTMVFGGVWLAFVAWSSVELAFAKPALSGCTPTMEFVATLEFLREREELRIPEEDARKMARKVATGCTGSAQRFIRVAEVLWRAGLGGADALATASELALRTDREAETFIAVFQRAFLAEYLDLDLRSAVKMARQLSTEFEGDVLAVRDDFERLLEFCVSEESLDLPAPSCGELAVRIARAGQAFSGGIAEPFIRVFGFARSENGPSLSVHQALKLSEEVSAAGRGSAEDFIQAYKYAVSKRGLAVIEKDALAFARDLVFGDNAQIKKRSKLK